MPANVSRLFRHAVSLPAETAFHAFNLGPVERRLYSRHIRKKTEHSLRLSRLSDLEDEVVNALKREGVYMTSLASLALPGTDEMVQAGKAIGEALAEGSLGPRSRSWRSTHGQVAALESYRTLFRWGLHLSLLRIVEGYLGLPPAYDGPKVAYTPADGRQVGTRLWHRDREDRRMMKIAIYLTDVPDMGGPLQCLQSRIYDGPIDCDFNYPVLSHEELERKMGRKIEDGDIVSCTGSAGTVVFMDTARLYHRGKPAVGIPRQAIFQSYFSRVPRHPFFCERSDLSRKEITEFAKEFTNPQQCAAVEWRKDLGWRRLIARSTV